MTQDRSTMSPYMRMTSTDSENREENDHYPTDPRATEALLRVEKFEGIMWEPACAEGYMSETLKKKSNCEVISSDIKYYGYGRKDPIDFLSLSMDTTDYSIKQILLKPARNGTTLNVVTNPPFKYAKEFVEKALELTNGKVAVLCRLMFLESKNRYEFFKNNPLSKVWVFSDRVPFQRGRLQRDDEKGGKTTPYAWFVFDPSHKGPATIGWIKFNPD